MLTLQLKDKITSTNLIHIGDDKVMFAKYYSVVLTLLYSNLKVIIC